MKEEFRQEYMVPMIQRAVSIMDYLYQKESPAGVRELSKELNIPQATVYKLLYSLKQFSFIEQDNEENYHLGLAFIKYGSYVRSTLDLPRIVRPVLEKYAKITGEIFNLSVIQEGRTMLLDSVEGEEFYLTSHLLSVSPLNCSSFGKIFLSELPEEELRAYFSSDKPKMRTVNSITTLEDFLPVREEYRKTGFTRDNEEYEYGLSCLALPIKKDGKTLAGLSLSGPTSRLKYKGIDELKQKLLLAQEEVHQLLKTIE